MRMSMSYTCISAVPAVHDGASQHEVTTCREFSLLHYASKLHSSAIGAVLHAYKALQRFSLAPYKDAALQASMVSTAPWALALLSAALVLSSYTGLCPVQQQQQPKQQQHKQQQRCSSSIRNSIHSLGRMGGPASKVWHNGPLYHAAHCLHTCAVTTVFSKQQSSRRWGCEGLAYQPVIHCVDSRHEGLLGSHDSYSCGPELSPEPGCIPPQQPLVSTGNALEASTPSQQLLRCISWCG
jgi:hypothetical protein